MATIEHPSSEMSAILEQVSSVKERLQVETGEWQVHLRARKSTPFADRVQYWMTIQQGEEVLTPTRMHHATLAGVGGEVAGRLVTLMPPVMMAVAAEAYVFLSDMRQKSELVAVHDWQYVREQLQTYPPTFAFATPFEMNAEIGDQLSAVLVRHGELERNYVDRVAQLHVQVPSGLQGMQRTIAGAHHIGQKLPIDTTDAWFGGSRTLAVVHEWSEQGDGGSWTPLDVSLDRQAYRMAAPLFSRHARLHLEGRG